MWFDQSGDFDPSAFDPLLPFHYDTNKGRWTSERARCWTKLHYQYDDLVPKPGTSEDSPQYLADLRKHINDLYPGTSATIQLDAPGYTLPEKNSFNDYIINVVYDRYALGGTAYSILFFLGKPPKDLSSYNRSERFVGLVSTFSTPIETADGSAACENCARQRSKNVLSKAHIPLTLPPIYSAAPLQKHFEGQNPGQAHRDLQLVGPLFPDTVEAVLSDPVDGLTWEFVILGGDRVERAKFPKTVISVVHGEASHGSGKRFKEEEGILPRYGGYRIFEKATVHQELGWGYAHHDGSASVPEGINKDSWITNDIPSDI